MVFNFPLYRIMQIEYIYINCSYELEACLVPLNVILVYYNCVNALEATDKKSYTSKIFSNPSV